MATAAQSRQFVLLLTKSWKHRLHVLPAELAPAAAEGADQTGALSGDVELPGATSGATEAGAVADTIEEASWGHSAYPMDSWIVELTRELTGVDLKQVAASPALGPSFWSTCYKKN